MKIPLRVVFQKVLIEILAKFTGKHLCPSLSFNKVSGLKSLTLLKRTPAQVLCCESYESYTHLHVFSIRTEAATRGVLCKKGVLRNFTKFTGKHLCQSLFFNKVRPATLLKKETLAQVLSCQSCKISKSTFLTEHVWTTASIRTRICCELSKTS